MINLGIEPKCIRSKNVLTVQCTNQLSQDNDIFWNNVYIYSKMLEKSNSKLSGDQGSGNLEWGSGSGCLNMGGKPAFRER